MEEKGNVMWVITSSKFLSQMGISGKRGELRLDQLESLLVEFAKLHVKAALEAAYNNVQVYQSRKEDPYDYPSVEHFSVEKRSILGAYPLENIK